MWPRYGGKERGKDRAKERGRSEGRSEGRSRGRNGGRSEGRSGKRNGGKRDGLLIIKPRLYSLVVGLSFFGRSKGYPHDRISFPRAPNPPAIS